MQMDLEGVDKSHSLPLTKLSLKNYDDLRKHVEQLFQSGKKRAQEAVEREKVRTYWQVGQSIDRHVLDNGKRADYGKQVIQRLSRDLKTNETLLYYALQFARTYKELPESEKLSWSHYRALLPIKNRDERKAWENKADEWQWSSRVLENAISHSKRNKNRSIQDTRRPIKGTLYTYRVVEKLPSGIVLLDLGFFCRYAVLPEKKTIFSGDLIKSFKESPKNSYRLTHAHDIREMDLYYYYAAFKGFKDGLGWFLVDLGFSFQILTGLKIFDLWDDSKRNVSKVRSDDLAKKIYSAKRIELKTSKSCSGKGYSCAIFLDGRYLSE